MENIINLKKIIKVINKIYEDVTDIKILQDELEDLLNAIDKTNLEYKRGKISKEIFDRDSKKFKGESVKIIKNINDAVSSNLDGLNLIENEVNPKKLTKDTKKAIQPNILIQPFSKEKGADYNGN